MSNIPPPNTNATIYPVNSIADVLAIVPLFLRPDDPAPVRDGIFAGILALCLTIQDWAEYAAAQASALYATGKYLDIVGTERQVFRNGQNDPVYRAAILAPPQIVTPTAIIAAANAILAPYTSTSAVYAESLGDRLFLRSRVVTNAEVATGLPTAPRAYIYREASLPRSPDYPDRYYQSEAAQNGGVYVPNREPGSSLLFSDRIGRLFVLRVPDISSVDAEDTPVYQEAQPNAFYTGQGMAGDYESYMLQGSTDSIDVYNAICNAVTRIKGQSIRWILRVDPNLTLSPPAAPTITVLSRNGGTTEGGDLVLVGGTNFLPGMSSSLGLVNQATLTSSFCEITTPFIDTAVPLTVPWQLSTSAGTSAAQSFTFLPGPGTPSISPSSGSHATSTNVTITTTNLPFGLYGIEVGATVGSLTLADVVVTSMTTMTGTIPAGGTVGAANVVVTVDGVPGTANGIFTFT